MGNNTGEHQVHWIELLSTLSVQLPQQNHKVRQQVGGCLMWGPGGGVGWVLTVRWGMKQPFGVNTVQYLYWLHNRVPF